MSANLIQSGWVVVQRDGCGRARGAPATMSALTIPTCPAAAAAISGVLPSSFARAGSAPASRSTCDAFGLIWLGQYVLNQ